MKISHIKTDRRGVGHLGLLVMVLVIVVAVGGIGVFVSRNNVSHADTCVQGPSEKLGSKDSVTHTNCVKAVQQLLRWRNIKGNNNTVLAVDGQFGANTQTAVKSFQRSKGLNPDGLVGPNTWAKLCVTTDVPKLNMSAYRGYVTYTAGLGCVKTPDRTPLK